MKPPSKPWRYLAFSVPRPPAYPQFDTSMGVLFQKLITKEDAYKEKTQKWSQGFSPWLRYVTMDPQLTAKLALAKSIGSARMRIKCKRVFWTARPYMCELIAMCVFWAPAKPKFLTSTTPLTFDLAPSQPSWGGSQSTCRCFHLIPVAAGGRRDTDACSYVSGCAHAAHSDLIEVHCKNDNSQLLISLQFLS